MDLRTGLVGTGGISGHRRLVGEASKCKYWTQVPGPRMMVPGVEGTSACEEESPKWSNGQELWLMVGEFSVWDVSSEDSLTSASGSMGHSVYSQVFILCYSMLFYVVLCCSILFYVLYCSMLFYIVICCSILLYVVPLKLGTRPWGRTWQMQWWVASQLEMWVPSQSSKEGDLLDTIPSHPGWSRPRG